MNIFTHVSELPGQRLAPLAAVCKGWQYEIEKLAFSEIVVHTDEHDMAIFRRVMGNSHRADCLSKITLSAQSGSTREDSAAGTDTNNPQRLMILRLCDFIDCLGSSARRHPHSSLTLDFDGFENHHVLSYDLEDQIQLTEHLRAHTSSQYGIGTIVLSLEKNQLPADLFEHIIRYCSPELKMIDLALATKRDDETTLYNTCEYLFPPCIVLVLDHS